MLGDEQDPYESILAEIFGALDKPFPESAREGMRKGLFGKMTLLDLSRVRDLILEELQNGERPRQFGLPEIWAAKKRLRAKPANVIEAPKDNWVGDDWDIEANHHLLAYVMRKTLARQRIEQWHMEILLGFKKAWARDMREASQDGTKPADCGKAWFTDCMRRAEETIAQKVAA